MPSVTYDLFRNAVINRKQVTCTYGGHARQICPHCIGYKNGREKVLSYQFAGGSSKGLPPSGEWRCMFIDDVSNVTVQDGPWHTGTGHSKVQSCVDDVDVEVS